MLTCFDSVTTADDHDQQLLAVLMLDAVSSKNSLSCADNRDPNNACDCFPDQAENLETGNCGAICSSIVLSVLQLLFSRAGIIMLVAVYDARQGHDDGKQGGGVSQNKLRLSRAVKTAIFAFTLMGNTLFLGWARQVTSFMTVLGLRAGMGFDVGCRGSSNSLFITFYSLLYRQFANCHWTLAIFNPYLEGVNAAATAMSSRQNGL